MEKVTARAGKTADGKRAKELFMDYGIYVILIAMIVFYTADFENILGAGHRLCRHVFCADRGRY